MIADARLARTLPGHARFPYDLFRGVSRPWLCLPCAAGGGCSNGVNRGAVASDHGRGDSIAPVRSSAGDAWLRSRVVAGCSNRALGFGGTHAGADVATEAMYGAMVASCSRTALEAALYAVRPSSRAALIVDISAPRPSE